MRLVKRRVEARQLRLASETLAYCLKRSSVRRTLALTVRDGGLQVHAPWHMPLAQIELFISVKSGWVRQKLAACVPSILPIWQDGMLLCWSGQIVVLRLEDDISQISVVAGELKVPLQQAALVRQDVLKWYRQQALMVFKQRLQRFIPVLYRAPERLVLSSARSRWGSCTAPGVVRLNWRLVQASEEEIDYVLAHELAHLTHMDHSAHFWCEVARLLPDFVSAQQKLRAMGSRYQQISLE